MYTLTRNSYAKAGIVFVISLLLTFSVFLGAGAAYFESTFNIYEHSQKQFVDDIMNNHVANKGNEIYDSAIQYKSDETPYISEDFKADEFTDYDIIITIDKKEVLNTTKESEQYLYDGTAYGGFYEYTEDNTHTVQVEAFLKQSDKADSEANKLIKNYTTLYNAKYAIIIAGLVSFLLCIIGFIILMRGAGKRDYDDEIHPRQFIDHIPADLIIFLMAILTSIGFTGAAAILNAADRYLVIGLITSAIVGISLTALSLISLMIIAVQIKTRSLLRTTIIGRLIIFIYKGICYLPVTWKVIGPAAFFWLLFMLVAGYSSSSLIVLITFLFASAGLAFLGYAAIMMRRLEKGAQIIASGDTSYTINTDKMIGAFKRHADTLNNINHAVEYAVEERMKSENMKTELITNVSHDIKTPLTSIINYTDLLAAEDLDNETAKEYIEIIAANAARLKKLTTDIVDASKASTGNVQINLMACDLGMMVEQALGEYEEKMRDLGIEPVVNSPSETMMIMADGQHSWRVLDNVMSNICKYTQHNTRVYIDVYEDGNFAYVSFKNISATQLNISAEQLIERFVRGDESRNTEGSGLGLSIAQNLARLQGGDLEIAIDGDLFKVVVSFGK